MPNQEFEKNLERLRNLQNKGKLPSVTDEAQLRELATISTHFALIGKKPDTIPTKTAQPQLPKRPQIEQFLIESRTAGVRTRYEDIAEMFGVKHATVRRIASDLIRANMIDRLPSKKIPKAK